MSPPSLGHSFFLTVFPVCSSHPTPLSLPEELVLEQAFYVFFIQDFQKRFSLGRGFCSLKNKNKKQTLKLMVYSCVPSCGILPSETWPTRRWLLTHTATFFPHLPPLSLSLHYFSLAHSPSLLCQVFLRFPQNLHGTLWNLLLGIMLLKKTLYFSMPVLICLSERMVLGTITLMYVECSHP